MKVISVVVFSLLIGCNRKAPDAKRTGEEYSRNPNQPFKTAALPTVPQYDKEPLSYAVLYALRRKLDTLNEFTVVQVGPKETLRLVAKQRTEINCIRAWAMKLPDRQAAEVYLSWLDYFSRGTDEAENEALHPKGTNTEDQRMERQREKNAEAGKILVIPTPKDCVSEERVGK